MAQERRFLASLWSLSLQALERPFLQESTDFDEKRHLCTLTHNLHFSARNGRFSRVKGDDNEMRKIIYIALSLLFFVTFTYVAIDVTPEGKFETRAEIGKYNSGNLVNVRDIKDGVASLSIDGNSVLMRENEVYEFKDRGAGFAGKPNYSGTVTIKSIIDEKIVIAEADVRRTKHFYIYIMSITAMFSILFATLIFISNEQEDTDLKHFASAKW